MKKDIFGFRVTSWCKKQILIKVLMLCPLLTIFGLTLILTSKNIIQAILFTLGILSFATLAIIYSSISIDLEEKKKHLSEKREERLSKGRVKIKSIEDITDYCQDSITMDVIYNKRIVSVNFKYLDLIKKGVLSLDIEKFKKEYLVNYEEKS